MILRNILAYNNVVRAYISYLAHFDLSILMFFKGLFVNGFI